MGQRRRSLGSPILAAALLAGCGEGVAPAAPAPPAVQAPAPASPFEALIARLGAPGFPDREAAERELAAQAPERYTDLAAARERTRDLEVQTRLDRILASPRIILAAAWKRAEAEGALGPVLHDHWFRQEHESVPSGYLRFGVRKDADEKTGKTVYRCVVEEEMTLNDVYVMNRIAYVCDADFMPREADAVIARGGTDEEVEGVSGGVPGEMTTVHGALGPQGWELRRSFGPVKDTLRLPWGPGDFPQEALIPLLPLWGRQARSGREILHNDIEYSPSTLLIKPQIVRDEGDGRISFRQGGEDSKPYMTLILGPDGEPKELARSDNLRGFRIDEEAGQALKAGFAKRRRELKIPSE